MEGPAAPTLGRLVPGHPVSLGVRLLVALTGCTFYVPELLDCTVRCASTDGCPSGQVCGGGLCRSTGSGDCGCQVGEQRACGLAIGECRQGSQSCQRGGAWSACVGEVGPAPEVCDDKDNDCDGLADEGPIVTLANDLSSSWRLHGRDSGYALAHTRAADGGLEALVVTWLDSNFAPVATSATLTAGAMIDAVTAMSGDAVLVAYPPGDGGLELVSLDADGRIVSFAAVPSAGRPTKVHLGASEMVVANWLTTSPAHPRMARWNLDGGLDRVLDLDSLENGKMGGTPLSSNLSVEGHYCTYEARATIYTPPTVDFAAFVYDTRTFEMLRVDTPYFGESYAKLIEQPQGALTSTYTYARSSQTWSGVYLAPDLRTLGASDEKTLAESHDSVSAWGDSDATLDAQGNVAIVYMDRESGRLVLARSVNTSTQAGPPLKRPLIPSDGFGVPRIAQSGDDSFLGLAWANGTTISARRVCGAR